MGAEYPRDFRPKNFCWRGKKKKGKWSRKEGKSKKGRWKIENGRRKSCKMRGEDFFFFFFCFSLFKTTEICFKSTKMWISYQEKAFHTSRKNQEKWLCPLWKIFHLPPWFCLNVWWTTAMFALSLALLWGPQASLCWFWQWHVDQTFPLCTLFSLFFFFFFFFRNACWWKC